MSPFYHYNRANYDSALTDPVAATQHLASTYGGGQASFGAHENKNDLQVGVYSFYQRNDELLGAIFGRLHWNNAREIFVELRYRFHY